MEGLTVEHIRQSDREVLTTQRRSPALHDRVELDVGADHGRRIGVTVLVPSPRPVGSLLFFHGGGFVVDGVGYDRPLTDLAVMSDYLIVVPELRLAPENPYPAPVHDAAVVTEWFLAGLPDWVDGRAPRVVGGDSSGGNLAAVTINHLSPVDRTQVAGQLLVYPMLDATASSRSCREFADTPGFNTARSRWYFSQYLPADADANDARISPLFAELPPDLPSTLVVSAGQDPLRDEAAHYVAKITAAGGTAELAAYEDAAHGFFQSTNEPVAQEAHENITVWLRALV